jgi:regulatory protein|tara:strand:+ start:117 stop:755 length:639 start_codon:yes stop_codon:yes gene_type:complete
MTYLITAIEPSKDDPNFRDIYVQGKLAMTLPFSTVEELNLTVKSEWNEDTTSTVKLHDEITKARHIAIDLISRRQWGSNELRTRLKKRGVEEQVAQLTVEQLIEDGWIDDIAFAKALIREWLRKEPAGRRWLQHKLHEKEIGTDVAQRAIDEELEGICEQQFADEFALKQLAKATSIDADIIRKKVISALNRKGFSLDVASQAYRNAQEHST